VVSTKEIKSTNEDKTSEEESKKKISKPNLLKNVENNGSYPSAKVSALHSRL